MDPAAPRPAAFNLAAHVLAGGAGAPDKVALQILRPTGAERWSYARLTAAVQGVAAGLRARGLEPGDRVLLRLGNTVEFPLAFLGAIAAGLVAVPTSAALTAAEIGPMAAAVAPRLILAAPGVALPDPAPCPVVTAETLRGWEALPPAPWHLGDPDRPGYIVFTSGTSGRARGVVHAHRAILARRMMWDGWYGLTPADRLLHVGAFNWTFTLGTGLMDPWSAGATALIPAEGTDPRALALLARRFDATIIAGVPGIFRRLLRDGLPPLPRLRHGLSAGEKLPRALREAWVRATGTDLHEAMGMSEVSTFVSGCPDRPAPPGTLGWPQPGRRVAVLGPDGAPVAPGEPGILAVHHSDPGLFLGYLDAPGDTAARFAGDWFLTGDLVAARPDGALDSLGRADDQINAGGYRISPAEVEAAFDGLPGLTDCAAVELTLPGGATVVALAYTGTPDPQALAARAGERLARWKQPRVTRAFAALPRGANGKLNRRAIRQDWGTA